MPDNNYTCAILSKNKKLINLEYHWNIANAAELITANSVTAIGMILLLSEQFNEKDIYDILNYAYNYKSVSKKDYIDLLERLSRKFKKLNPDCNIDLIKNNIIINTGERIKTNKDTFIEKVQELIKLYNENFLRIRFGDPYQLVRINTLEKVEFYVRIASNYTKWFDLLWEFVYKNQNRIKDITIVRDDYAGCNPGYYYLSNKKVDHMDVNDFITLPGNPELDTYIEESYMTYDLNEQRNKLALMKEKKTMAEEKKQTLTKEELHKQRQEEMRKRHEEFLAKLKERREQQANTERTNRAERIQQFKSRRPNRPERPAWFVKKEEAKKEKSEVKTEE